MAAVSRDLEPSTRHAEDLLIPDGAVYVTAEQLVRRYQVRTLWVYAHSDRLGGTPLSDGRAARKRFHLPTADAFMASRRERPTERVPPRTGRQPRERSRTPSGAPLLTFR
jgi:1,2-phenylacetyl-CoA epoxidase PaaB subunit